MEVRPHDRGTFLVSSESVPGDWYIVDLRDPARPEGRCSCEDYTIRIDFVLNKREKPDRLTCKHIRASIDFALAHLEASRAAAP